MTHDEKITKLRQLLDGDLLHVSDDTLAVIITQLTPPGPFDQALGAPHVLADDRLRK